jgi:hypothetical protein
MSLFSVFDRRFRGFRVIEIGGVGVALALALVVYLAKTHAGAEGADIDRVQQQISDEQTRISLLRAEVANLEQPERLGALAQAMHLQPIDPKHEIDAQALAQIAHATPPVAAATPVPASATTAPTDTAAPDTAAPVKTVKTKAAPVASADTPAPDDAVTSTAAPAPTTDAHP